MLKEGKMTQVAEMVGNLFRNNELQLPETVQLMSQRELKKLPLVEVIAVDPANKHEVDDAFGVQYQHGQPMQVSTVIAYGASIGIRTPEFAEALDNGWSKYPLDGSYIPMISNPDLVTYLLSLIEGELRPGLELGYRVKVDGRTVWHQLRKVSFNTKQISK